MDSGLLYLPADYQVFFKTGIELYSTNSINNLFPEVP